MANGSVGVRVDVTQLKEREERVRLENSKLDAALQDMSHGLVSSSATASSSSAIRNTPS